jgi:hypothetical protein
MLPTTHLDEPAHGLAIGGHDVLLISVHNAVALRAPQLVLRQVQVDLVAVEVRVERRAVRVVHADHALALRMGTRRPLSRTETLQIVVLSMAMGLMQPVESTQLQRERCRRGCTPGTKSTSPCRRA